MSDEFVRSGGGSGTPGPMPIGVWDGRAQGCYQVNDKAGQRPANAGDMEAMGEKLNAIIERLDKLIGLLSR